MKTHKQRVKDLLKSYGDQAGEHFGISQTALNGYIKRGKYPVELMAKVFAELGPEQPENDVSPSPIQMPVPPQLPREEPRIVAPSHPAAIGARVDTVEQYLQQTVDFYLRQFGDRLAKIENAVNTLHRAQMKHMGVPSLARPDAGVPVEQVFTTNPNPHTQLQGNSLDTGIAPTREMVDAQANDVIIEGVHMRGAELARPAMPVPAVPPFGFGWNQPRPPRR